MAEHLDPDLLRTFVAIADAGSFTDAARHVGRTQSAVSMQMKRLEETLGRPLFARNGRGVRLSTEGEKLLIHARRLLRLHQETLDLFTDPALSGEVRLGVMEMHAATVLPNILVRFAETHPRVHVEVVCDGRAGLLERLDRGDLDLALSAGDPGRPATVVRREPLVWAASAAHDVHTRSPVPLAAFHPGCDFRASALAALAQGDRPCRVAYTSMSLAGILAAVRAGLAVTALPRFCLTPGLRLLSEADGFPPLPDFPVIVLRGARAGPLAARFARHIVDDLRATTSDAA